jgi:hypothetical protein
MHVPGPALSVNYFTHQTWTVAIVIPILCMGELMLKVQQLAQSHKADDPKCVSFQSLCSRGHNLTFERLLYMEVSIQASEMLDALSHGPACISAGLTSRIMST